MLYEWAEGCEVEALTGPLKEHANTPKLPSLNICKPGYPKNTISYRHWQGSLQPTISIFTSQQIGVMARSYRSSDHRPGWYTQLVCRPLQVPDVKNRRLTKANSILIILITPHEFFTWNEAIKCGEEEEGRAKCWRRGRQMSRRCCVLVVVANYTGSRLRTICSG